MCVKLVYLQRLKGFSFHNFAFQEFLYKSL